jgi:hypothetical protein
MKFYEFELGKPPVYDLVEEFNQNLSEVELGKGDKQLIDDCADFAHQYCTDPATLTKGKNYFAITVISQPRISLIQLEYSNTPVCFIGVNNNKFEFKSKEKTYLLPILLSNDDKSLIFSTTVFAQADEANQFLTMFMLKFSSRAHINKKELVS